MEKKWAKSVQLVIVSFFRCDFLRNPYFSFPRNLLTKLFSTDLKIYKWVRTKVNHFQLRSSNSLQSTGDDYSVCGKGRNAIKYNADGEEKEQVERINGTHPLRVAGGWPADRNEWPWIVMMMNRGNQFCDGSIIDEWHILTAAHCVAQ